MGSLEESQRVSSAKKVPLKGAPFTLKALKFAPSQIAEIEEWRAKQRPIPFFTDAVRQLISLGIKGK